jgi:CHAT domain-containing protein/tetratricopeptide (TPR) repeat protein
MALFVVWLLPCASAVAADQGTELRRQLKALRAAGRYAEAEAVGQRLLAYAERYYADKPKRIAIALDDVGQIYLELGKYDEAERLIARSLEMFRKMMGPDDPNVANGYNNLAAIYKRQGRYQDAERSYRQAMALNERYRGPNDDSVATTASNLALVCSELGQFEESERLFKRALQIFEDSLGAKSHKTATVMNNLAGLYEDLGRFAESGSYYKRALKIDEEVLGANHPGTANALNNLAKLYTAQGRYDEAEPLHKRELAISRRNLGDDHPAVGVSLSNLAVLYEFQGRYDEAEALYLQALPIEKAALGTNHPSVAGSLGLLAGLYRDTGRLAEAEQLLQQALAIDERTTGRDSLNTAATLGSLAAVYRQQSLPAKAEPLLRRCLKIEEQKYGPDSPDVAGTLIALARVCRDLDRDAEAESAVERALAIFEASEVGPRRRFYAYLNRATLRQKQGRFREAAADLEKALEYAEQQRAMAAGSANDRATLFDEFGEAFAKMVVCQIELGEVSAALAAAERGRARSLIDQLRVANVDLLAGVPDDQAETLRRREAEAQALVAKLTRQIETIDALAGLAADERQQRRRQLEASLAEVRQQAYSVYRDMRSLSPAYRLAAGQRFEPIGLEPLQDWLAREDAVLLEYVLNREARYLFVVPPEGKPWVQRLGTARRTPSLLLGTAPQSPAGCPVREAMRMGDEELLAVLSRPKHPPEVTERLALLGELLLPDSVRKAILTDGVKRLIVVPDGPLSLLPLDVLVLARGNPPRYLLDVGPPIVYGPSATVLHSIAARSGPPPSGERQPVLTVGRPVYARPGSNLVAVRGADTPGPWNALARYRSAGGQFADLPFSEHESRWVADVFGRHGMKSGQLIGRQATEANVRFNVPNRRVVHLACHGLTDQQYGNLFGALALTPGPASVADPADDGLLTLAEIYRLNLRGCELAILSACQTNYGPQQRGEGVWALSRGFLVAGARRVVASNWLVDDEAAATLMSYFASIVARTEKDGGPVDYAGALHRAKQLVRREEKWESPYYWGTFVLVGPN